MTVTLRLPWVLLMLALVPAATFYWQYRDIPNFGSLQDDAVYAQSGKSIATGQGYRLLHLPGKPYQVKYPPVYPLLVAALWQIRPAFPANLAVIVLLNQVALAAMLAGLWRLNQKLGFARLEAALLAGVVACLPAYIYLAASVMTEVLFVSILVWALVALEDSEGSGPRLAALGGLLAAVAYLTRSAGAPLLLTAPVCFLLRRQFRHAGAFVVAAAPLAAAWQWWTWTHKSPVADWVTRFYLAYGDMERVSVGWDNVGRVVYQNADTILTSLGEMFIFGLGHSSALGHQCSRLVAVGALVGSFRMAQRSRRRHYPAFGLSLLALMLFWHYPPDQRFFVPLAPLLAAGLWVECRHLWELAMGALKAPKVADRIAGAIFAVALSAFGLCVIGSLGKARMVDLPEIERAARADAAAQRAAFEKLAQITAPGDTILSDQDVLLSLYTERAAYRTIVPPRLFYPFRRDLVRDAFSQLPDSTLRRWDYAYVSRLDWRHALDSDDREKLRAQIDRRADLERVWQGDNGTLYVRRR